MSQLTSTYSLSVSKTCRVSSCKKYYKVAIHRKDQYEYQYCPKHRTELAEREAEEILKRREQKDFDLNFDRVLNSPISV